jgi:F420-dependent oxidoreductase-like protein
MAFATLESLAGTGRVIAGLGLSGPQIVEGWYGQPWGRPYWRLRDYIQIMRKVNRREEPVRHEGREISLPYTGEGSVGLGKPLMSILHTNPDLPIWLGSGSESTVKLTAELCDGWLPLSFVPGRMDMFRPWIEEGFRRAGRGKSWDNFEIQGGGRVVITDDIPTALRESKPQIALYVGGMGHPTMNFHNTQMRQRGYPEAAERIQELFLAGRKEEAIDAVPDEFVDEGGLYGSPERIATRWQAWEDSGITGFTVSTEQEDSMRLMARLAGTG